MDNIFLQLAKSNMSTAYVLDFASFVGDIIRRLQVDLTLVIILKKVGVLCSDQNLKTGMELAMIGFGVLNKVWIRDLAHEVLFGKAARLIFGSRFTIINVARHRLGVLKKTCGTKVKVVI